MTIVGLTTLFGDSALAQPAEMDRIFSSGLVAIRLVRQLAVSPDGKILVQGDYRGAGASQGFIARLNTDGSFDTTFQMTLGPLGSLQGTLRQQPDGKILAVPWRSNVGDDHITRLNADGSADTSFSPSCEVRGVVSDFGFQSDGKILVRGGFTNIGGLPRTNLARLNADGTPDDSFRTLVLKLGNEGRTWSQPIDTWALQTDGKLLIGGEFMRVNGQPCTNLARLNLDGSHDQSFTPRLGEFDYVKKILVQPDGRIVVGGSFVDRVGHSAVQYEGGVRVLLLRFNSDGTPDPKFTPLYSKEYASRCLILPNILRYQEEVRDLLLQNDGKFIISKRYSSSDPTSFPDLARLNPDGTLDGNFDAGVGSNGEIWPIVLDTEGNLVLSGCFTSYNGQPTPSVPIRVFGGEPPPGPPAFKREPLVELLDGGATLILSAIVSGFPAASCQWQVEGRDLAGATHATLVLTDVNASLAGSYQLVCSNALGMAVSQPIGVSAPVILAQPASQSIRAGAPVTFSVLATNLLPFTYQWQWDGHDIAGATNATLDLEHVQTDQAGQYRVVLSNLVGTVTSVSASLTVLAPTPPEILVQPQSVRVEEGLAAVLSVVATNYLPLAYQWRLNGLDLAGATQAVLSLPEASLAQAGWYRVVVSSELLSVTSHVARVEVNPVLFVPGPGVVTNRDQASLEEALASGAPVTFGINGSIRLTNTLVIRADTTLDASGRRVTLDGQNRVRHFVVTNGACLRLVNLRLVNGRDGGATGETNQNGAVAWGGSIHSIGSRVELTGCQFEGNQALGGQGGPWKGVVIYPGRPTFGGVACGGAIYLNEGELWAKDCRFEQNGCAGGDGVMALDGYAGGGGTAAGGAIYGTNAQMTLLGTVFTNNLAEGGSSIGRLWGPAGGWARGGALVQEGGLAGLSHCEFALNRIAAENNAAGWGGAIFQGSGAMEVIGTLFRENVAEGGTGVGHLDPVVCGEGNGGAVFNRGDLEVRTSAFVSNEAKGGSMDREGPWRSIGGTGRGGAICDQGHLTVVNSTLAGNRASGGASLSGFSISIGGSGYGGAVFSESGPSFLNVTLADNVALTGRGIITNQAPVPEALGAALALTNNPARLANTILKCPAGQAPVFGTVSDLGHNICSDVSAQFTSGSSRDNLDPRLGPLAENGGPTPTMALLPGSPAIDAGDDALAPATDQRGVPRPLGSATDIGAFELEPKLTLSRSAAGEVRLEYVFLPGQTNTISASADLATWNTLSTGVTDGDGRFTAEDTEADQYPVRFYRVESPR